MTSSQASEPAAPRVATRSSVGRRLRRLSRTVARPLVPLIATPVLRALASSWRTEIVGENHLNAALAADGALWALWHGRMMLGLPSQVQHRMTVLVSPSRDGSLMDPILRGFSYDTVRGSSSRGGARALRELLERLRAGGRIVITPDGPRGPRHGMNEGLAWMARATGFPVLPIGLACDRLWRMSSWDQFNIPKWRARIVISYGEPLWLPKDSSKQQREDFTRRVRASIVAEERRAFAALGIEPDFDPDLERDPESGLA